MSGDVVVTKPKVLLVGIGFLGKHLAAEMLGRWPECTVTALDLFEPSSVFNFEKMAKWENDPRFTYLWKSAGDVDMSMLNDYDVIIYTAAIADVPYAIKNPIHTMQVNVMNLTAFITAVKLSNFAGHFILTSSESVYGKQPPEFLPLKEDAVLKPDSIYSISKACQEHLVTGYCESYGIPYVIFRCATMFGEGSRLKQAIPEFAKWALEGKDIVLQGDGSGTRDFNYVMNTVNAIIQVIEKRDDVAVWNQIYNIGSGEEITIENIARVIAHFVGPCNKAKRPVMETEKGLFQFAVNIVKNQSWRPGEKGKRVSLSIEKAKRLFDYYPVAKTIDGIRNVIKWLAWYVENFDPEEMDALSSRFPSGLPFEKEYKVEPGAIKPEEQEAPGVTPEILARLQATELAEVAAAAEKKRQSSIIEEVSDEAIAEHFQEKGET